MVRGLHIAEEEEEQEEPTYGCPGAGLHGILCKVHRDKWHHVGPQPQGLRDSLPPSHILRSLLLAPVQMCVCTSTHAMALGL